MNISTYLFDPNGNIMTVRTSSFEAIIKFNDTLALLFFLSPIYPNYKVYSLNRNEMIDSYSKDNQNSELMSVDIYYAYKINKPAVQCLHFVSN